MDTIKVKFTIPTVYEIDVEIPDDIKTFGDVYDYAVKYVEEGEHNEELCEAVEDKEMGSYPLYTFKCVSH